MYMYTCCDHKTSPHTLLLDPSGKLVPLVLIVYKFDGVTEHTVLTRPHGNAKTNKPYRQTRETTKNLLKLELEHSCAKGVDKVFTKRGGILSSQSAGELPRGRSQAYSLKKMQQEQLVASIGAKAPTSSGYGTRDMLYVVIEQCRYFCSRCCVCTRAYGCPV